MSNFKCQYCGMTNIDCGESGYKTPRELELEALVKELEEKYKWYDHYKDSALRNRDLCNEKIDEIKKLEHKLEIAKEALQYYADGEDIGEAKIQGSDAWRYIVDDNYTDIAKQTLQKMENINATTRQ